MGSPMCSNMELVLLSIHSIQNANCACACAPALWSQSVRGIDCLRGDRPARNKKKPQREWISVHIKMLILMLTLRKLSFFPLFSFFMILFCCSCIILGRFRVIQSRHRRSAIIRRVNTLVNWNCKRCVHMIKWSIELNWIELWLQWANAWILLEGDTRSHSWFIRYGFRRWFLITFLIHYIFGKCCFYWAIIPYLTRLDLTISHLFYMHHSGVYRQITSHTRIVFFCYCCWSSSMNMQFVCLGLIWSCFIVVFILVPSHQCS